MIRLKIMDSEVTDQVQDASRASFILSTLSKEQKALAGLVSPSGVGMSDFGLLGTEIAVQAVCSEWLIAEPEEALGKSKTPVEEKASIEASIRERV